MGHRPEVAPEPFAPRRSEHHVAALRRHIQARAIGIVERKAVHRHQAARLERPLVRFRHVAVVTGDPGVSGSEPESSRFGFGSLERLDEGRRVGKHHRLVPARAESIDRPVAEHADADALDRHFRGALLCRRLGPGRVRSAWELMSSSMTFAARAASSGDTVAVDRSSAVARARRSSLASPGMRAYIITTPEKNQATNSTPPAIPSQRCV
jgi:hypothetical protein